MIGSRLLSGAGYMKVPAIDLAEVGAGGRGLIRLDRRRRGIADRTAQRRRFSGSGLLWTWRHCTDDHGLQSGIGIFGS